MVGFGELGIGTSLGVLERLMRFRVAGSRVSMARRDWGLGELRAQRVVWEVVIDRNEAIAEEVNGMGEKSRAELDGVVRKKLIMAET